MDNETKELLRQTKMAWYRGRDTGLFMGIVGTLFFGLLIKIIW